MKLSPRYDGPPIVAFDGVMPDPSAGLIRQRTRFADALGALSNEEWSTPTRCDAWSVQDVVEHLVGVNQFWAFSIQAGLRGEPTRVLASFDPVAVPASMVEASRGHAPEESLEQFVVTNAQLAACVTALDDEQWSTLAEAPPGHVALHSLALHALWDSWIHERDVFLPLGRVQDVEPDEILGSLAYAVALGPALRASTGVARTGTLGVVGHEPSVELNVAIGSEIVVSAGAAPDATATIEGSAVELIEGLSVRGPAPKIDDDDRWMITGLDEAFDAVK